MSRSDEPLKLKSPSRKAVVARSRSMLKVWAALLVFVAALCGVAVVAGTMTGQASEVGLFAVSAIAATIAAVVCWRIGYR